MITFEQAKQIAERYLSHSYRGDVPVVLLHECTSEESDGWIFVYNSAEYMKTRNPHDTLLGNLRFLVERSTGQVRSLPPPLVAYTAEEIAEKLAQRALDTKQAKNGTP